MFLLHFSKILKHLKVEGVGEKKILFFLLFLKVHDQLQFNGISKRFDAQRRDCTQIVDFSM